MKESRERKERKKKKKREREDSLKIMQTLELIKCHTEERIEGIRSYGKTKKE